MLTPRLATIVYWGFIAWLLLRDSKKAKTSVALWIPTIWVGIFASKPVIYWFSPGAAEASVEELLDGDPLDRNIMIVLLCLAIWTLLRRHVNVGKVLGSNKLLLIFYSYLALSVLWSDYPFVAFKRYVRDVGNIAMILVMLTEKDPVEAVHRVLLRCAYVLIPLSVLLIKYYPEIGRYYTRWTWTTMYAGATTNKNSLGLLTMASALVLLWSIFEASKTQQRVRFDWLYDGIVLVMCFWILNIANSATALSCLVVGAAVMFACRLPWLKASPARLTVLLYIALATSAIFLMSPTTRGMVAGSVGRDPTLTTRTDIWAAVMSLNTNFLFGAGYNSVWLTDAGWKLAQQLEVPHAHNGYLESYLNIGIVGVTLLVMMLLSAVKNAAKHLSAGGGAGALLTTLVVSGMIYNYTEVTFNTNSIIYICLTLAALWYSPAASFVVEPRSAHLSLPFNPGSNTVAHLTN